MNISDALNLDAAHLSDPGAFQLGVETILEQYPFSDLIAQLIADPTLGESTLGDMAESDPLYDTFQEKSNCFGTALFALGLAGLIPLYKKWILEMLDKHKGSPEFAAIPSRKGLPPFVGRKLMEKIIQDCFVEINPMERQGELIAVYYLRGWDSRLANLNPFTRRKTYLGHAAAIVGKVDAGMRVPFPEPGDNPVVFHQYDTGKPFEIELIMSYLSKFFIGLPGVVSTKQYIRKEGLLDSLRN